MISQNPDSKSAWNGQPAMADRISEGVFALPENSVRAWSRGEDLPIEIPGQVEKGTILVVKDASGLVLGTGRVSARGLKNLLPRHLALKS